MGTKYSTHCPPNWFYSGVTPIQGKAHCDHLAKAFTLHPDNWTLKHLDVASLVCAVVQVSVGFARPLQWPPKQPKALASPSTLSPSTQMSSYAPLPQSSDTASAAQDRRPPALCCHCSLGPASSPTYQKACSLLQAPLKRHLRCHLL